MAILYYLGNYKVFSTTLILPCPLMKDAIKENELLHRETKLNKCKKQGKARTDSHRSLHQHL